MTFRDLMPFGKKDVSITREEHSPLYRLRKEMDSLFDDFFRGFDLEPSFEHRIGSFNPTVDVSENDKEIKVTAELPGIEEKEIDVTLNRNTITIKGEKKEEKEDTGKDYYRMERSYGSFSRSIPLPSEIELDKASAKFKKGVLTIKIPKTAKAIEEKKKIPITVE